MDSYGSSEWEKTIVPIVDWYTNSNGAPLHIGIILAQSALESLAYSILRYAKKPREPFKNHLRKMLEKFGIDTTIPQSCNNLEKWLCSRQVNGEKDGPTAITKIRNALIHSKKGNDQIPPRAQMEACDLALWYVEIVLLLKFGYEGPYRNRVSKSRRWMIEHVSESKKSCAK